MMKRPTLNRSLIAIFLLAVTTTCVTVKLTPDGGKRAEGVKLNEPNSPFTKESRDEVDAAWKNTQNGNVISYLSDCQDPTDPPLSQITTGVLTGLSDLSILSEKSVNIQGREGRRVHASGKVDGVPTEIDLLAFKRNHCIYLLSYVGVQQYFAVDQQAFERFIREFRAP